jgi:hypothetical protein
MLQVLNKYTQNGYEITEYTKDGITVSHRVENVIQENIIEMPVTPSLPTTDERLTNIENTLDLMLLKQEGIL